MQKYWFKAKHYGWGWYPSSWQGFVVLVVYFMLLVLDFVRIDRLSHSGSDTLYAFVVPLVLLTAALLIICYITGEKPKWRWGK